MKKKIILFLLTFPCCLNIFANETAGLFEESKSSEKLNLEFSADKMPAIQLQPLQLRKAPPPPSARRQAYINIDNNNLISNFFVALWALDNIGVSFDDYPYADGKYLNFEVSEIFEDSEDSESAENAENSSEEKAKEQFYRFSLGTGFFYYPSTKLFGNENRFEGYIWKFFGPVFESTSFAQDCFGSEAFSFSGNLKLGGQISIIHSNYFDLSNFLQWSYIYGNSIKASGICFGFILRSYPVNPILLEWRVSVQNFFVTEETILESHLELGIELSSPVELYVNYRYYNDCIFTNSTSNGFSCGVKYNF